MYTQMYMCSIIQVMKGKHPTQLFKVQTAASNMYNKWQQTLHWSELTAYSRGDRRRLNSVASIFSTHISSIVTPSDIIDQ